MSWMKASQDGALHVCLQCNGTFARLAAVLGESWADARSSRWCGSMALHFCLQCNCTFVRLVAVLGVRMPKVSGKLGALHFCLPCNCAFVRSVAVLGVAPNVGGELGALHVCLQCNGTFGRLTAVSGVALHVCLQCNGAFARLVAVLGVVLKVSGELAQPTAMSWVPPSDWGIMVGNMRAWSAFVKSYLNRELGPSALSAWHNIHSCNVPLNCITSWGKLGTPWSNPPSNVCCILAVFVGLMVSVLG